MARPRTPLKFKYDGTEYVFRADSVHTVVLVAGQGSKTFRVDGRGVKGGITHSSRPKWRLSVNGQTVYMGSEKVARKHQERALRYVA